MPRSLKSYAARYVSVFFTEHALMMLSLHAGHDQIPP